MTRSIPHPIRLWLAVLLALAVVLAPAIARADDLGEVLVAPAADVCQAPDLPAPWEIDEGDVEALSVPGVNLRPGTYERFIDRIEVPSWARYLYDWLVENSDNDGSADWLISDRYFQPTSETVHDGLERPGTIVPAWNGYAVSLGVVGTKELDDLNPYFSAVYYAFFYDHPEVFWTEGYGHGIMYTNDGRPCAVAWIYGDYDGDHVNMRNERYAGETEIRREIATRDEQVRTILAGARTMGANAYTRVKYFDHWLTTHNQYNTLVANDQEPLDDRCYDCLSALVGNTGVNGPVCQGYAHAFKVLCDAAGIPCVVVSGMANGAYYGGHAWNLAKVFGQWYAVDVTWDDPTPSGSSHESGAVSGRERDKYLLVGSGTVVDDEAFDGSHEAWAEKEFAFTNEPQVSGTAFDPRTAPRQVDVAGAEVAVPEATYTGEPVEPVPAITYNGEALEPGVDCFLEYSNNVNAGTATLKVVGMEGYTGAKTVRFTIAKAVPRITLDPASAVLEPGGEALELQVGGSDGRAVSAKSSDTSIVKVRASGQTVTLTPGARGSAVVTVTVAGDANHETAAATVPVEVESTVTVWRLNNAATGEHLFTTDANEYRALSSKSDWQGEGVAWRSPATGSPVWRLFQPGTGKHLYTTDANERRALLGSGKGWRDEGTCWYSDPSGRAPVYRLYNPALPFASAHHYTLDEHEYAVLAGYGWRQEGVSWYAVGA